MARGYNQVFWLGGGSWLRAKGSKGAEGRGICRLKSLWLGENMEEELMGLNLAWYGLLAIFFFISLSQIYRSCRHYRGQIEEIYANAVSREKWRSWGMEIRNSGFKVIYPEKCPFIHVDYGRASMICPRIALFNSMTIRYNIIMFRQWSILRRFCNNSNESMQNKVKLFLLKTKQNGDFNQYWYSNKTILFLANQALLSERCCFLSTPSIYYAIENPNHQKPLFLFDYDAKFAKNNPNFFQYDFNHPQNIPEQYHNSFDFVLADPPFITHEVWTLYAQAIRKLIRKDEQGNIVGRILLSTIEENQQFLIGLLGVTKRKFKPSIPHLVYQYCLFSNYEQEELDQANPEIIE